MEAEAEPITVSQEHLAGLGVVAVKPLQAVVLAHLVKVLLAEITQALLALVAVVLELLGPHRQQLLAATEELV